MYAIFIMLECLLIFNTQKCTARSSISRFISSARKRYKQKRVSVIPARKRYISAKAFHQRVNAFNKLYQRESVIASNDV